MTAFGEFPPPRRRGLIVHVGLAVLLSVLAAAGSLYLGRAPIGPEFIGGLAVAILPLVPVPFLAYRAYALRRARYAMTRNSLVISWGLRTEEIPLSDIEWMRMAGELTRPLRLPPFPLPGGLLGRTAHPDLGEVEFLASESSRLVLVSTARRVFVISPGDPALLMQTFARATELGALLPTASRSLYPSFVLGEAWARPAARFLWLAAAFLNAGLFAWVGMLIPSLTTIALGAPVGSTPEPAPSTQLILLPLASFLLVVAGWLTGLYLFRWERERPLAFVVWGSSVLMSLAFLTAVLFIVSTPI